MDKKSLGLVGLLLGTSLIITIPLTNIKGYFEARERLEKYGSVEKAIQSKRDDAITTGVPSDQIYQVYFGIGANIAYSLFEETQE